jgi:hypothetical protein
MHAMRSGSIALGLAALLAGSAAPAMAAPQSASELAAAAAGAPAAMVDFIAPLEVLAQPQAGATRSVRTLDFSRVDIDELEFRSGIWSGELLQMQRAYAATTLRGLGSPAFGVARPPSAFPLSFRATEPNFTASYWLFQSQITRQFARPLLVRRDNELFGRRGFGAAGPQRRASGTANRGYPCSPGLRRAAFEGDGAGPSGELQSTARISRFFTNVGNGFNQFTAFIWRLVARISGAPRESGNC